MIWFKIEKQPLFFQNSFVKSTLSHFTLILKGLKKFSGVFSQVASNLTFQIEFEMWKVVKRTDRLHFVSKKWNYLYGLINPFWNHRSGKIRSFKAWSWLLSIAWIHSRNIIFFHNWPSKKKIKAYQNISPFKMSLLQICDPLKIL